MEVEAQLEPQTEDEPLKFERRVSDREPSQTVPERSGDAPASERGLISRSALFDRVGALVMIFDREGRIRWFNRVCEETTGLSFEEVWGKLVWEVLVPPKEADIVKRVLANLRTGRFTRGYESHLMTRDGIPRIVQWSTAPLFDSEGPVEHIVGVGVDITDRKRAEERLRRSEEHYRGLVESSPDAIFVHHRGNVVFANRAGAALLGASDPGDIIGRPVLDFVHPKDRAAVEKRLKKVLEHDTELALIEERLVRLDGSAVRVDAHSIFPFMYQKKPAVQVVVREVGDATLVQEQAREYRDMWESVLSVSSAAIIATDLRGRITEISQRAAELVGLDSADEAMGKSAFELILAEDHEEFIRNLQKTFREGIVRDIDIAFLRKDGSQFRVDLDMALLRDSQGKPRGFVAAATEITRRRARTPVGDGPHDGSSQSSALLEASRAVLVYHDFEPAAREIFEACKNLIGAGAGYVGLMNEDATKDNILFSDPAKFAWTEVLATYRPMRELRAEVYLTSKAMYLNELSSEGSMAPGGAEHGTVESILFAPLTVGDTAVGLLGFADKDGEFTEEDARMASAFGELAAVSLESCRALEALELSEERFRSVAETLVMPSSPLTPTST